MTYGSGGPGNLIFSRSFVPRPVEPTESFSAETVLAELCRACGGRSALARLGGADFLAEWDSLSHETRSEDFFEALLGLAHRQELSGHLEIAIPLTAALVAALREGPLLSRAQHHLNAMTGRGDALGRAEFMARRVASEACDPALLAAMGVAGLAFRMTRLATLSRLAASPAENLLTRGLGARLLSGVSGLLVEAPTFTLAHRVADVGLGREIDLSTTGLTRDLGSGALTLLSLRLMGGLSGAVLRRVGRSPSLSAAALRTFLPQASLFGGLLLSHRLETGLGLREHRSGETSVTDALITMLSFHTGGRLAHQAFCPSFAAQERGLEVQAETLGALNRRRAAPAGPARRGLAWAPALSALGLGLHTLLRPAEAMAQDPSGLGGILMMDPLLVAEVAAALSVPIVYGLKRLYERYRDTPPESPQFFQRHRARILSGLGGPAPADAALAGEAELIAERLRCDHEDTLYRNVPIEELLAALTGGTNAGSGPFRGNGRFPAQRAKGPRVFDIGVDLANRELTRILELTHPLPQTPLPEKLNEDETLFRIGHRIDLQHFADAIQKPILALPLHPGSTYHLAIPLYHGSAGYVMPTYARGVRGITAEQFSLLGNLGGVLDGRVSERAESRPFLIENDGSGYLVMDWQSALIESVPQRVRDAVAADPLRVNGEPLRGKRPSHPLSSGDRIQMGAAELLWIAPRPGFRMALIRAEQPPPPSAPALETEATRARELFMNRELDSILPDLMSRPPLPPEFLQRFRDLYPSPLLRLPDLIYQVENGTRILLSPRLRGGESIPVGINPGAGGIYLHGAWNPGARRYAIQGQPVEFYLREEGSSFFLEPPNATSASPIRIFREGVEKRPELRTDPEAPFELLDGDIIEFGPPGQRTRLAWFHNLDANPRGERNFPL